MISGSACVKEQPEEGNVAPKVSLQAPVKQGSATNIETERDSTTQNGAKDEKLERASKKRKIDDQAKDEPESSEDEKDGDLRYFNAGATFFGSDYKLDEQRQKASKRLMQSKAYTELVEDRILALESKIRQILHEPEKEALVQTSPEPAAGKTTIAKLVWSDFSARKELETVKNWKHRPDIDTTPKNVIEILVEEPQYNSIHSIKKKSTTAAGTIGNDVATNYNSLDAEIDKAKSAAAIQRSDDSIPFMIRIRSPLLLKVLQDLTSINTVVGPHKHILVFFRPFKLLVAYAEELQKHLEQLDKAATENGTLIVPTDGQHPAKVEFGPSKETESLQAREELRLLCKTIADHLQPKVQIRKGLDPTIKNVSFNDLWYIFKPGREVRTPGRSQIQLYRVMKVTGGREVIEPWKDAPGNCAANKLKQKGYSVGSFVIECFYIHYDGTQFGPVNVTFQIRKFEGQRDISTFPIIPFDCDENKSASRQSILKRGIKFAQLAKPQDNRPAHREYKGLTLGERKEQVESQVIIDFELAFLHKPEERPEIGLDNLVEDDGREIAHTWRKTNVCNDSGCCGNDYIFNDYEVDEKDRSEFKNTHKQIFDTVDSVDQLTDDQKVLLPHKVFGFVLRSRKWDAFDLDLLEPVNYGDGWKNLVIDETIKETVLALVQNHARPHKVEQQADGVLSSVDLVRGKGKGLIILLHGEPGVGKTSTAECVADHTKRPLFPITCGDIGETAETVENSLETNFQLAHKWGCVLLLDEADIFLAKRTGNDIKRNAIVSVFLRSLEYYSGILFLTTNRVGTIDRAFKSRIHLSLYFPKLDKVRTEKVWKNNIDRLSQQFKEQNKDFEIQEDGILKFSKKHFKSLERRGLRVWNGRQIRNAFQTAAAIALYEAIAEKRTPVLAPSQFKKVADSAKEFDKYLEELNQGMNDADQAQHEKSSLDDYDMHLRGRGRQPPIRRPHDSVARKKGMSVEYDSDSDESSGDSESSEDTESASEEDDDRGSRQKGKGKGRTSKKEVKKKSRR